MNVADALATIRKNSSIGRARLIDLYHHGEGQVFQITADDLIVMLERGIQTGAGRAAMLSDHGGDPAVELSRIKRVHALLDWLRH